MVKGPERDGAGGGFRGAWGWKRDAYGVGRVVRVYIASDVRCIISISCADVPCALDPASVCAQHLGDCGVFLGIGLFFGGNFCLMMFF